MMEFLAGYIISASEVINNIRNYNKLMRLKNNDNIGVRR